MSDLIDRQAAINALENDKATLDNIIRGMSANDVRLDAYVSQRNQVNYDIDTINNIPTAQPEQLSDAYMKAVWAWLLNYQVKAAELKGRYTPYEVLSWVANDWRKEHERSD